MFPNASTALTVIGNPTPAATLLGGGVPIRSFEAAAGVTVVEVEVVASFRPVLATTNVYEPTLFTVRFENVATPFEATALRVPPSVAPPGLFARPIVTVPEKLGSRTPKMFRAET